MAEIKPPPANCDFGSTLALEGCAKLLAVSQNASVGQHLGSLGS